MLRNTVEVLINEKPYEMVVNVGSMMEVEKVSGKGFMDVLKSAEQGDLLPISILLAACLKSNGKSVGLSFIESLYFDDMQELFDPLMDAIGNAFPSAGKEKNVKTVQKVMK